MNEARRIRRGQSSQTEARAAVLELHAQIAQQDAALVLFFSSSEYDLDALTEELNRSFGGVPVVGCTTAGEIGPAGYRSHSIVGISFPSASCTAVAGPLEDLQHFTTAEGEALAASLLRELEGRAPTAGSADSFGLMLIDGLSIREEQVARSLQNGLGKIRLFGGSAGDDMKFEHARVFYDGAFHADSVVLVLVSTSLPFRIFRTQHFACEDERLVVTEADPTRRIVREINGLPAAAEYARLVGVTVEELRPDLFATAPVVVVIDGTDYVRAIQKVNADGSLTFFSAIDEGLVFRVARGVDLVANLNKTFSELRAQIGPPQLVIACDCILRNLEITQKGLKDTVGEILRRNEAVGFSTYGEQIDGVHMNQTLTGIAIGSPDT